MSSIVYGKNYIDSRFLKQRRKEISRNNLSHGSITFLSRMCIWSYDHMIIELKMSMLSKRRSMQGLTSGRGGGKGEDRGGEGREVQNRRWVNQGFTRVNFHKISCGSIFYHQKITLHLFHLMQRYKWKDYSNTILGILILVYEKVWRCVENPFWKTWLTLSNFSKLNDNAVWIRQARVNIGE